MFLRGAKNWIKVYIWHFLMGLILNSRISTALALCHLLWIFSVTCFLPVSPSLSNYLPLFLSRLLSYPFSLPLDLYPISPSLSFYLSLSLSLSLQNRSCIPSQGGSTAWVLHDIDQQRDWYVSRVRDSRAERINGCQHTGHWLWGGVVIRG